MTNICKTFVLFLVLFFSSTLFAFPDEERAAVSAFSSQATSLILDEDRFLYASFGDDILRMDTETFALAGDQVPALTDESDDETEADLAGDIAGLAIRGDTLFATQTDGDLLTVDLNDITAEPEAIRIQEGALGPVAADTEGGAGDDKLYILDKANNALLVHDISDGTTGTRIPLVDSLGAAVAPVAIAFVPFPTDSSSSATDKIFITTNSGFLFVINEGESAISQRIFLETTNKELPALAATPGGNFLLVVNATDTTVHVIDTATNTEVDADPTVSGTDPISLPQNGSLKGVVVTDVEDPDDVYAYVTGSQGISVIDLNLGTATFSEPTVLDFNDTGSDDDEDDPLTLGSIPGPVVASSAGDGYVYTSNSNASVSVISDNPFVAVSSTSLGSGALTTGGSFTVTFQSDETGSYRVLVGGGLTANGTEVTSGTVDAADTDVTTASIPFDSGIFSEGTNRVFVFVTDGAGNRGRDAVDITVDTPPPEVEIVGTGFGNEKVFVEFTRLTVSDLDHYNVYVDTSLLGVATKSEPDGTVPQPESGETIEARITGLTNGVTYFLGVEAVDASGNVSETRAVTFSDGTPATAMPEETVGLAEATGEGGCALVPDRAAPVSWAGIMILIAGLCLLCGAWRSIRTHLLRCPSRLSLRRTTSSTPRSVSSDALHLGSFSTAVLLLFSLLFFSNDLLAEELTPQWWSLEFKGGAWMPLNGTTKNLLGSCCGPTGSVEFGFLYKSKLGVEVGVGYVGEGGSAVGATSGATSRDRFDFTMIPIQNSVTFRADFKEDQILVPYVKFGLDYLIFRENVQGNVTRGVKLGLHTAGGLQILLDLIDELSDTMEKSLGVNDVYLTLEGRYAWVDSFGGRGVDLSNLTFSGGFLFEF